MLFFTLLQSSDRTKATNKQYQSDLLAQLEHQQETKMSKKKEELREYKEGLQTEAEYQAKLKEASVFVIFYIFYFIYFGRKARKTWTRTQSKQNKTHAKLQHTRSSWTRPKTYETKLLAT